MRRLITLFFTLITCLALMPSAQAQVGYSPSTLRFGGTGNWRPMPTSGTLSGVYYTDADWVQTGPIVANEVHAYFTGNVTFNNSVGGVAGVAYNNLTLHNPAEVTGVASFYGAGGSHCGQGGRGFSSLHVPPYTTVSELFCQMPLYGGPGWGGTQDAEIGGAGGAGFYVECRGNITLTSAAAITCNGAQSTYVFSQRPGSGAGGGFDARALGSITINAGATVTANGGDAINASSDGGGGGGGLINFECLGGFTNNGTLTAAGGAPTGLSGTGGGAGIVRQNVSFHGPRTGNF
jgi:hypothetical protein